ncbi:MAG TPA: ATP phosphoribosyltransferase regulatory subunit [Acetobacteraceae bacterium]|jgi:ATP phosphoribosyltransferase regulatory subunit|nr:ATP phosphoribosyltransferase regulatory subunit [Acetobacteraceae bacterium]
MNDDAPNPALLPAGLRDLLPPEAEVEASAVEALMAAFAAHGYQRVKPPLLEFEDSLFASSGAAVADQTFRLMDPDTHRPMGVRADMTPQVARIAATRMLHAPRPLRLSYSGQCLRVRGASQLAPDRQIAQAGFELIGPDSPDADAEMVLVGAEALAALGLTRLSFDLTLPQLVPTLLEEGGVPAPARAALSRALDRKDAAAVASHGGPLAGMLASLLLAAGPADPALAALAAAPLTPGARALSDRLAAVIAVIRARAPALRLTVDPVEFRGLRYHTGVSLTVYAPGRGEEFGRGGRYVCGDAEPATGLTLYPDALLRAAPPRPPKPRVYLPPEADHARAAALRADGYATVAGFAQGADPAQEARRLGCTHLLHNGALAPLDAKLDG